MITTEQDLITKIWKLVKATNQRATAAMLGISTPTLRSTLTGGCRPGNKLLKALGVERVTLKKAPVRLYQFTVFTIGPQDYPPLPKRGAHNKGSGVYSTFNGIIPTLRSEGTTLQEIGDRCGVSRERIRQILNEYYPENVQRSEHLVSRNAFAVLVGHSTELLRRMEDEGVLTPIHRGPFHLYDKRDADKIKARIEERIEAKRKPLIELTCEACGSKFRRKSYLIRKRSPGRFCSKKCVGAFSGNHYGFKAHPENITYGGRKRKWDYDEVYKLRDATGWGSVRIGRALGIPFCSVDSILQKRKRDIADRRVRHGAILSRA